MESAREISRVCVYVSFGGIVNGKGATEVLEEKLALTSNFTWTVPRLNQRFRCETDAICRV